MASVTPSRDAHGRHHPGWRGLLGQVVVVVLAVLAYFGVRGLTQSDAAAAEENAREVVAFERGLGIDVEASLQDAIVHHDLIVTLANWVYIYGHWPVVVATLVWLLMTAPGEFRLLRNAMFASGAIGLVIFALYPVAPPRLGVLDVLDTVTDRSSSYRTLQPPGLINRYAAMPSLHFGWNLLVGVALWRSTRSTALRAFAVTMPVLMAWAVVLTANHYVVDVLAGGAVALAGLVIARSLPDDLPAALRRGRSA
jgi:hypothetical protein